jgi:hypothetical protein
MSNSYQYFSIPFDLVPTNPRPYTVWYATWSTTPPALAPGMTPPLTVAVTSDELPPGAISLGFISKDPPMPPPPLAGLSEYKESMARWLQLDRDADE